MKGLIQMERFKRQTEILTISELYDLHIGEKLIFNESSAIYNDVDFMNRILKNEVPPPITLVEEYDMDLDKRILTVQTGGNWLQKALYICDFYLNEHKHPIPKINPVLNSKGRVKLFWHYSFPVHIVSNQKMTID